MKSLLLSHEHALSPGGGGQQQCSREYVAVLQAAGCELVPVTYRTDRAWAARLRRKLQPAAYASTIPEAFFTQVRNAVERERPDFVLCNLNDFIAVAPRLKKSLLPGVKMVLLSHGLVSVDEVHKGRIARTESSQRHLPPVDDRRLGGALRVEAEGLPCFDHAFCLAEFEVGICRWLGAKSVSWWPRTLPQDDLLEWRPAGNRVGIVGTLDHPPNLEGVFLLCEALAVRGAGPLRLRLVTRSTSVAADLAARYPFVDVLGALDDDSAVRQEAATWSAFLHPIFCHAMGCSTKVATGLGWGLPLVTSTAGLRGYLWREGGAAVADAPQEMAAKVMALLDHEAAHRQREETLKALRSAPTLEEVGGDFRRILRNLSN